MYNGHLKVTKLILANLFICLHISAFSQFNTVRISNKKGTVSLLSIDSVPRSVNFSKNDSILTLIGNKKVEYNLGSLPLDDIILTSEYGKRKHPLTGVWSDHHGIDLRAKGKYVYAVQQGIITDVGYNRLLGEYVKLTCGTFEFVYGHLDHVYKTLGARVGVGEIIGQTGDTGRVTAEHLHFGIKNNGVFIDPYPILSLIYENSGLVIDPASNEFNIE